MAVYKPKVSEANLRRPTETTKNKGRMINPPRYPDAGGFMQGLRLKNPLQTSKPGDTK